jgi:pimeloyl-ACP methyl ester carboxylesterase
VYRDVTDRIRALLLPGLDGTGDLFARFLACAPSGFHLRALRLPSDRPRDYRELADWLIAELPDAPVALIAESFSGPLAVLVANRSPRIAGVVLCASFVRSPLPGALARLSRPLWRRAPPAFAIRFLMTGGDAALAQAVRNALASVDRAVVAARIRAALTVDVRAELQRLSQPLLWLRATRDRLIHGGLASAAVRALGPSAELLDLDAPHLLLQSKPAEAWRRIQPFLERLISERCKRPPTGLSGSGAGTDQPMTG